MEADQDRRYVALREHLHRLPGGFPPSDTGSDVRLLRRLFTPEEAETAVQLTIQRETAEEIAPRLGLTAAKAEARLERMAQKGLILAVYKEGTPTLYQSLPFIVGIYEFQMDRLTDEFVGDLTEYRETSDKSRKYKPSRSTRQMRVIPGIQNVEVQPIAFPYEMADNLVDAHDTYAVAPCICRTKAGMLGESCDETEDSCIMFGEWADTMARTRRARYVDRDEVKTLLRKADDNNLVLQPSNSKRIMFVCCCCGCCCGVLRGLKALPNPGDVVESPFIAELTPQDCTGCWSCLERCQMNALSEGDETVVLNQTRCIGCGLCVSTCPSEALELVRRPGGEGSVMGQELNDTWQAIIHAQSTT